MTCPAPSQLSEASLSHMAGDLVDLVLELAAVYRFELELEPWPPCVYTAELCLHERLSPRAHDLLALVLEAAERADAA